MICWWAYAVFDHLRICWYCTVRECCRWWL